MLFKTSTMAIEIKKKPIANEILTSEPDLATMANDQPVQKLRVVTEKKFLWLGKGKELQATVILTDPETKKPVPTSEAVEILEHYENKWLDPTFGEVKDDDVHYFVVADDGTIALNADGSKKEVAPFDPSDTIEIEDQNWIPAPNLEEWKISYVYELYASTKAGMQKLFEEWERHEKRDEIGITTFSNGHGFKQYYAFLVPFQREGKWVWLLCLSDTKKKYDHTEDVPTSAKVPIKPVPTLSKLPPIQELLIVPAAARKRK
jgi:hypothetical protein